MTLPDLNNLTLVQVFGLLALIAAFDVLGSIALAIVQGKFSLGAVAIWLQSHTLRRAFPIFALAVIGKGVPPLSIPEIAPAFAVAIAGLAAYILETVASLRDSFADASRPVDTEPDAN
jgi:hypothetical protein